MSHSPPLLSYHILSPVPSCVSFFFLLPSEPQYSLCFKQLQFPFLSPLISASLSLDLISLFSLLLLSFWFIFVIYNDYHHWGSWYTYVIYLKFFCVSFSPNPSLGYLPTCKSSIFLFSFINLLFHSLFVLWTTQLTELTFLSLHVWFTSLNTFLRCIHFPTNILNISSNINMEINK